VGAQQFTSRAGWDGQDGVGDLIADDVGCQHGELRAGAAGVACRGLPSRPFPRIRAAQRLPGCAGAYRGIRANIFMRAACSQISTRSAVLPMPTGPVTSKLPPVPCWVAPRNADSALAIGSRHVW
jgi:hypothetical protein